MQIQSGKLYENRTWRYLYPCLKNYGQELTQRLANFFKLAVGVGDLNREDDVNCIYILIDTNIPLSSSKEIQDYKNNFTSFLDWLSYQPYYVSDYVYEKNMHMIVIKLPEKHVISFSHFIKGSYSNMFSLADLRNYFSFITISNKEIELEQNKKLKITKNILSKDKSYIKTFVKDVNERFKTDVEDSYFNEAELDYPPEKKEEIFNFKDVEEVK